MRLLALVPLLSLAFTTPPTNAQSPDLDATLPCRITRLEPESMGASGFCRLEVEVRNEGDQDAEPLVFEVEIAPAKRGEDPRTWRVARAQSPLVYRRGRPVEAGGKTSYWLQIPSDRKPPRRRSVKVRVVVADLAGEPGTYTEPPVRLGTPRPTRVAHPTLQNPGNEDAGSVVPVQNPLGRPVDIVVRARYSQPRDATGLFAVRLSAESEQEFTVDAVNGKLAFDARNADAPFWRSARIEALEIVDWCVVEKHPDGVATEKLRAAYERWARWDDSHPPVSGRFHAHHLSRDFELKSGGGAEVTGTRESTATGRFSVTDGVVRVEIDGDPDPGTEALTVTSAEATIEQTFKHLLRPRLEDISARLELVAPDRVLARPANPNEHPVVQGGTTPIELHVQGDRIVGDSYEGLLEDSNDWTTRTVDAQDGAWVVTKRVTTRSANEYAQTWSYTRAGADVIVPTRYHHHFTWPYTDEISSSDTVTLTDFEVGVAAQAATLVAPRGPGATRLAEAWDDGSYRYPDGMLEWKGKIRVDTPGTDLTWAGFEKVSGKLKFRARLGVADVIGLEFLPDQPMATTTKSTINTAIFDRFLMWRGRDFQARESFAEVFRGATIGEVGANGRIPIDGSIYTAVRIEGGRVAELESRSGMVRRFGYEEVAKDLPQVATVAETGGERLRARYRKLATRGDEVFLLPTEFVFERVFGRDWGPEKIVMRVDAEPE